MCTLSPCLQMVSNSSVNCSSISSISQHCLYSHSVMQMVNDIKHYVDEALTGNHPGSYYQLRIQEFWLSQLFSDGLPEESVRSTLFDALSNNGMDCRENDSGVQCEYS